MADETTNQIISHLQSLLAQETDPKNIAYLTDALRKIANITTPDDLIAFLNTLQADYFPTKADYQATKEDYQATKADYQATKADYQATKALSIFGGMPVLFRLIQNLAQNSYRYKYENFTRFSTSPLPYFNTLQNAKPYITPLGPQLILCPNGKFYYEMDFKDYNGTVDEYIIGISFVFLKNTTTANASVSLTARLSSNTTYTQTYGGIFVDNATIAEYVGSTVNSYSSTITVAPGTHILTCLSGAYPYGNSYGELYQLRHDIDLSLPNGVYYDYEAYRQILS